MTDDNFQILPNTKPVIKGGNYELKATLKDTENLIGEKTITWNFSVAGDPPETPASKDQVVVSPQNPQALFMPAMGKAKPVPVSSPVPDRPKLRTIPALTFKQTDIQAVFPPAGNLGDHTDLLPQIILGRSTLPWEYRAVPERNDLPGLALLLFDEEECPEPQAKTLAGLEEEDFEIEAGQDPNGTVMVIDVRRDALERILPSGNDLTGMAQVRRGSDAKETAVLVCNRPPRHGVTSTVHLVSMAGRYQGIPGQEMFDYQNATRPTDLVRLVSVYHWQFTCQDEQHKFKNLLLQIDSGTLRLPPSVNADAEKYLARGCVPLLHTTRQDTPRQARKTVSWYHGPLVPGENTAQEAGLLTHPIRVSDELMRFNPDLGVFDVSYAAAWELGRFLALQSKSFASTLFQWKESHVRRMKESKGALTHLPFGTPAPAEDLPPAVRSWLEGVEHLEGIPFNYLVPDESMLQPGYIRFFYLDRLWLECLQKGALSLGRSTRITDESMAGLTNPSRQTTGFLLRSEVVAGWPDLLVDGYLLLDDPGGVIFKKITTAGMPDLLKHLFQEKGLSLPETLLLKRPDDHTWEVRDQPGNRLWYTISFAEPLLSIKLQLLRMDTMAKDILICLFDGKPDAIDIRLKPEGRSFRVHRQAQGKLVIHTQDRAERTNTEVAISPMIEPEEKVRFKLV